MVDRNILPYCSIDRKQKKTLGEMEQEFLQALQVPYNKDRIFSFFDMISLHVSSLIARPPPMDQAFYYDQKAIMSNEEFDNLKEELMWEGSSVVMLSKHF